MTMQPVMEAGSLTKFYGRRRGVEDLAFTVRTGEIFGCLTAEEQGQLTRLLDRIAESLNPPA